MRRALVVATQIALPAALPPQKAQLLEVFHVSTIRRLVSGDTISFNA